MSITKPYDLIVIGAGPAGEKGAAQAAYFGKRVAIIEKEALPGGACVHTGTLPSKCLRESALTLSGLRASRIKGVDLKPGGRLRVEELLAHKNFVCATEVERIRRNLERHKVDCYTGNAEFVDAKTVLIRHADDRQTLLSAPVSLIATGTRPHRPTDIPFDREHLWDSDDILDLHEVPHSMIVYGAGVIGCEYASMFAVLGVKVTLVEPRDRILPFLDDEVSQALVSSFQELGIDIHSGSAMETCRIDGGEAVVTLKNGTKIRAERFLYAAGRDGNSGGMGLDNIGVAADKRGLIAVNAHYETACPGIYAAGDIIGFPALASTSMDQARIAMCHAFDLKYKTELNRLLPYGIYTIPEVSMIGDTEQDLQKRGEDFETGRAWYRDNARGRMLGDPQGFVKLVFRPNDKKLLGAHVVGERAADLVHIGLTVMQFGGSIDTFIDAVYNYPTVSECFKYAAYDGLGRLARRGKA
ncbi:MAG: FAD-dependent pyridine nucleotide-disulfide oxidoreductase [Proteobacteria bacterium]|nr:FAD-dependent pyridine nucleotide-disulfide oxidoreductase [Pseudomonadota bacterium]